VGVTGIRPHVRHGSVTATWDATRPKRQQRLPEGNRWSDLEPPSGFEPETYALRVSVMNGRSEPPPIVLAGQVALSTLATAPDRRRTATRNATAAIEAAPHGAPVAAFSWNRVE